MKKSAQERKNINALIVIEKVTVKICWNRKWKKETMVEFVKMNCGWIDECSRKRLT